jgi:hypothetical protein
MDDPEVVRAALGQSGLPADALLARAQTPEVKDDCSRIQNQPSRAVPSAVQPSLWAARYSSARTACATSKKR